jgi:hypothetical protein
MSSLSVSVFGPDMVLNQRQVLVIVSDWEPYLGSLFCVGFGGWLFPVSVFYAPVRTVSVFTFIILYSVNV